MKPTVGILGLGIMGQAMAERLLSAGLPLVAWNRTAEKADALVARGVQRPASPRALAEQCGIVITVVTDGPALEEVLLRPDGIAAGLAAGKVHCDMSTIDPETTRRITDHYANRGAHFVHAPVLGNWQAAASGSLLIFAGGPPVALEKCQPVLGALGKKTWQWERAETATHVKLACNLLLGSMMELLCETLVFAAQAGVHPHTLLEIIGSSALAAPMYQRKGEAIARRHFTPSFYLRHMLKDMNLVVEAGKQLGVALPATTSVRNVYNAAAQAGYSDSDYSSVLEWLESRAGQAAKM